MDGWREGRSGGLIPRNVLNPLKSTWPPRYRPATTANFAAQSRRNRAPPPHKRNTRRPECFRPCPSSAEEEGGGGGGAPTTIAITAKSKDPVTVARVNVEVDSIAFVEDPLDFLPGANRDGGLDFTAPCCCPACGGGQVDFQWRWQWWTRPGTSVLLALLLFPGLCPAHPLLLPPGTSNPILTPIPKERQLGNWHCVCKQSAATAERRSSDPLVPASGSDCFSVLQKMTIGKEEKNNE